MSCENLIYLNSGARYFGDNPNPVHQRGHWEFQAILSGQCCYVKEDGDEVPSENCLWVSSPDNRHGWQAESRQRCEIVTFHFLEVTPQIEQLIGSKNQLQIPLDKKHREKLKELYREVYRQMRSPDNTSGLYACKTLYELSIMVMELSSSAQPALIDQYYPRIANQAIGLFLANMQDCWSVEHIAESLNMSSGHLRRIFKEVYDQSPREIFHSRRLMFARDQLLYSSESITAIAYQCGFSTPSVFCRHFKTQYGTTPLQFRRNGLNLPYR